MKDEGYEPVSCDYHDQLEAAAMHREEVELEFDLEGAPQRSLGRVSDVYTAAGAEWVRFETAGGSQLEIRLDHIISMREK